MADRWLVLGGWAVDPRILEPLFGAGGVYVDVNELMPFLIDNGVLNAAWVDIVKQHVEDRASGEFAGLAGWSAGAIVACAFAPRVRPEKLVLLSATPSFCRREGLRFGWRAGVLQAMRKQLFREGNTVVRDFMSRAAVPETFRVFAGYDEKVLAAGLAFLDQVNLMPFLGKPACRTIVLHGRDDKVIPYQAGEAVAEMLGTKCRLFDGGHAFFAEQNELVRELIRSTSNLAMPLRGK